MVCSRCRELIPALSDGEINESDLMGLVVGEYSRQVSESFYLALKTYASFDIEVPVIESNDLHPKWFRITGATAFNRSNTLPQMHGLIEDISDRKRIELLKRDHLAIVSHDLRSPLSVIKLYIQLFEREIGNPDNHLTWQMLKKAGLQIEKMNNMIECYLESPAIGAGEIKYSPVMFNIKELFEEIIDDLRLLYPGYILLLKRVAVVMVFADREKICQVIQNLLSNAIKYSSQTDVININFRTIDNYLQVEIQDHGMGIRPADQKKIFDRFYRVERVSGKPVKGYGIGLYLTKQILKQHHGDIWLESEINKGSKFYFTLPCSCL
jgi:signal transduction histidine kinase